ncbi:hypothetical protein BC833DRAFT_601831 [Globomyces pollinis-pini]|nr:hypothetical protein BC833DRAFT_601831 [Globomyces pollinis-pini]
MKDTEIEKLRDKEIEKHQSLIRSLATLENFEYSSKPSAFNSNIQTRITIKNIVCGLFGFQYYLLFDHSNLSYPPDILLNSDTDFHLSLADIPTLIRWDQPQSLLNTLNIIKSFFVQHQLRRILDLGIYKLSFELDLLDQSSLEALLQTTDEGIIVYIQVPFKSTQIGKYSSIRFDFYISPFKDSIERVETNFNWVGDPLPKTKIPPYKSTVTIMDYIADLELSVDELIRQASLRSQIAEKKLEIRKQLLMILSKKYEKYLLEYDDDTFTFLSLYVIMATPLPTSGREEILGASIVNIHLSTDYPDIGPVVTLSSPIHFNPPDSYYPATRELKFTYNATDSPKTTIENIRYKI